jgi:hypothetical protein
MGFRLFFFSVLTFLAGAAAAADGIKTSSDKLHWRCWYDQQTHITCLVDTVPQGDSASAQGLPANLPHVVRVMRTKPGALRNRIIHIPLHTEPYDMEFTAILAKATVCGSRRDCSVNFTDKLPPAEEIVAILNRNLPDRDTATVLAMLDTDLDDIE